MTRWQDDMTAQEWRKFSQTTLRDLGHRVSIWQYPA